MAIDRYSLIHRNNPVLKSFDKFSPFSVGNGEFVFTADITGLQTFYGDYVEGMPLCTMSNWGWHTSPQPEGVDIRDIKPKMYDTFGRQVGYYSSGEGQEVVFKWLRENPHRFHLGNIGFEILLASGEAATLEDITDIEQTQDLWCGIIKSKFCVEGIEVAVETLCHPVNDCMAVKVESKLFSMGRLAVEYKFPYPSPITTGCDWENSSGHQSVIVKNNGTDFEWARVIDSDKYFVDCKFSSKMSMKCANAHSFILKPADDCNGVSFVTRFSPEKARDTALSYSQVYTASSEYWQEFWQEGGAVDFSGSTDERAAELERRVVLSQYLLAIQSGGSVPPQETGLTCNSWFGKAHLEMHWWHSSHFPLWGRADRLDRSMWWYKAIMDKAEKIAKRQGYEGVRWPKMVCNDGVDSPSPVATLLIWQQPHPIFYAELLYRANPSMETLESYKEIVSRSAEFMYSFAHFDKENDRYVLGAPFIPAQENHHATDTLNATYELEYWYQGLSIAQEWNERLGLPRNPKWDDFIAKISKLPIKDGVYLAHENCPETFTKFNIDHPAMLNAFGVLPGALVDKEVMRKTILKVIDEWVLERTWGWDYPVMAMTAARLGETKLAVDCFFLETPKNRYHLNGHNYQRPNLPLYLPGNGGLLSAIAMMVAGWDGGPETHAPGFPSDGTWNVKFEGIGKYR